MNPKNQNQTTVDAGEMGKTQGNLDSTYVTLCLDYNKHKTLQHSKEYSNTRILTIKMLMQQGNEYAEKLEQMQNWRTKTAKRLVTIARYYHDTGTQV